MHLLQADAMMAASEANTTVPESTELGSPFHRRRHELQPSYTAADNVALTADKSASGIQYLATHSSTTY